MPEFVLEGRDLAALELDAFTLGYVEALFFTETSPAFSSSEWFTDERRQATEDGQADGELPGDTGFTDLHPDALARIVADCERFQRQHADLLEAAYALEPGSDEFRYAREPLDAQRAGQLFWYARNGHGVSWTDNGHAECLEKLQAACGWRTDFPEVHVWFGDHVTYGDEPLVHVE